MKDLVWLKDHSHEEKNCRTLLTLINYKNIIFEKHRTTYYLYDKLSHRIINSLTTQTFYTFFDKIMAFLLFFS